MIYTFNFSQDSIMTRIIQGVSIFQKKIFGDKEELFQKLSKGQSPLALFITCSDSRINPNLLTQTEPGELFILRNAGNLVPPHNNFSGGEEATVEYAIKHLKIRDIILCGHSKCGAMNGLIQAVTTGKMDESIPAVNKWLSYAAPIADDIKAKAKELSGDALLTYTIEKNVLQQMIHLKTFPSVQEALSQNQLRVHSWVYRIESGEVTGFDHEKNAFVSLDQVRRQKLADSNRSAAPTLSGNDISI